MYVSFILLVFANTDTLSDNDNRGKGGWGKGKGKGKGFGKGFGKGSVMLRPVPVWFVMHFHVIDSSGGKGRDYY